MKAIAIVELPDDAFDKGKWYLDKIYYTENESLFDDYANDMWELKPLPKREKANKGSSDEFKAIDEAWTQGFNACLSEITGEMK